MDNIPTYALPGFREPVSCFTHLFAAPVFAVLGYYLVRRGRGNVARMASLAVMAVSSVFLLSMSGVYHLLAPGTGRDVMRLLDLAGVFALIAGTTTPVHTILFTGPARWAPLVLVWLAAAAGATLTTLYSESLATEVAIAIYLLLGWGGLFACVLLWRRYGLAFVEPLIAGGLAYTVGSIFFMGLNWPAPIPGVIGAHELWHVAVLVGLGFHWQFVFRFADGRPEEGWGRGRYSP